jgi:GNAT superfamily N-acetyltransferase
MNDVRVYVANLSHLIYVNEILKTIEESAKVRGTGIAKRKPEYIESKILEGKAIIALENGIFVGFCYIETWGDKKFVANSGLIVRPEFRGQGIAKNIKEAAFKLSRERYPDAKIFGLTTALAVMKINTELGYRPVTFSELTDDEQFWKGCQSCVNYDILQRTERKHCLCTGMIYDPIWEKEKEEKITQEELEKREHSLQVYGRWFKFKEHVLSGLHKSKKEKKVIGVKFKKRIKSILFK